MLERELDGFVVVDLPSVRWLTGFTGSNGLAVISAEAVVWPPTAVTRHRRLRSSRPQAAMPPSSSPRTSLPVVPMGSRVQPGLRSKATSSAGISSANGLRRLPTVSSWPSRASSGAAQCQGSSGACSHRGGSGARRRRARRHGDAADARHDRAAARACARRRHAGRGCVRSGIRDDRRVGPQRRVAHARPSDRALRPAIF